MLSSQSGGALPGLDTWPAASPIFGSLALTFFAFTGFAVISNSAGQMANPKRDLPRAMEATILIVLVLYMGVALAVVSSVSADELQTSGLTISAVLALIMINFLSLTTVASLGGATTLLVYSLVNFSALRLLKDKGPHRILVILAAVACTISIVIWTVHAFKTSPHSLSIFVFFLVNYGVRVKCQSGLTDIVGIVLLQVESKGRFQSGCDR